MAGSVAFSRHGAIAVARLAHPPVNALSHALRAGLMEALERTLAEPDLQALVLLGDGRMFSAGADVREFGQPFAPPPLGAVIEALERAPKPVIAALHGSALGGGLELALACHFRIAHPDTRLALPEVRLGIIPGGGGTQRLPRLIGARAALAVIAEGRELRAPEGERLGLIDALAEGDAEDFGVEFAAAVLSEQRPLRRTGELTPRLEEPGVFEEFSARLAKRQRGFLAPLEAVRAVRMAFEVPFAEGLERELALCMRLLASPQSRAQRHAFTAERDIARIPGITDGPAVRPIASAAVVGAGVMGRGIAICLANAGIPVQLIAHTDSGAAAAAAALRKHYEDPKGGAAASAAQPAEGLRRIRLGTSLEPLTGADLIVEAISEEPAAKATLLAEIGRRAHPRAILASNTSFLDLTALARASGREADFAGMHFFNPAQAMRLVEIARTPLTAAEVSATLLELARRLGKVPVLVGAIEGLVANRMLARRSREALFMLEEGALPEEIDRALTGFGFPLGPLAVADLGGLDVVLATRRARWAQLTERERAADLLEQLTARGRLGQKSGAGWYRYDAERRAQPDPEVAELIAHHSAAHGRIRRAVSETEIVERCLYAMINEGARLLEAGIVPRPQEIDVIWLNGLGFPAWRGGPMYYADTVGLPNVLERLRHYAAAVGADYFAPAPLIERLVHEGRGFYVPAA